MYKSEKLGYAAETNIPQSCQGRRRRLCLTWSLRTYLMIGAATHRDALKGTRVLGGLTLTVQ